nr:reverse transcriptase domain-containing protein [Tanacetum cinerariifolium]
MSAMANTTPIVTTVTKAANKEKTSKEADAALKVNILDICEEHYEDILLVIMDKICRDKYRNPSERPKRRDRLRHKDENVFDQLGHRKQSVFDRLSDTYSPSITKSDLDRANSRDRSHGRGRSRRRDSFPSRDRPRGRDRLCGIEESYGNTCSSYRMGTRHRYHSRDRDRSRSMKREGKRIPIISRVKERHQRWRTLEVKVKKTQAYMRRRPGNVPPLPSYEEKLPPIPKRKVTHRKNHRTNPSGMFQSGDLTSEVSQGKDGGLTGLPLTRTPKEILAAKARKFKPPPPMVTLVEKRSSNKFCDFHNDKGHSTNECVQLKKHIKELVRAGKLSHLIKKIKQGRDQPMIGKKEVSAKDKSMEIYMVQPWHRMTRHKVTQSFAHVRE